MNAEQEEKYEQLVRELMRAGKSALQVSKSLNEVADKLDGCKVAIIKAHIDIEESEGYIIPYRQGHGSP